MEEEVTEDEEADGEGEKSEDEEADGEGEKGEDEEYEGELCSLDSEPETGDSALDSFDSTSDEGSAATHPEGMRCAHIACS